MNYTANLAIDKVPSIKLVGVTPRESLMIYRVRFSLRHRGLFNRSPLCFIFKGVCYEKVKYSYLYNWYCNLNTIGSIVSYKFIAKI